MALLPRRFFSIMAKVNGFDWPSNDHFGCFKNTAAVSLVAAQVEGDSDVINGDCFLLPWRLVGNPPVVLFSLFVDVYVDDF